MRRVLRARLLASALAVCVIPFVAAAVPAQAQEQSDVSFDSFHDQLAQYGDWVYSDRWGLVWQPGDVSDDFRPYDTGGHWAYTDDYGWVWASDFDWGDITFHYGRWVDDPYDGWMWIPGYTWSPGWVVWRSNEHSVGWMPMPPDDRFLRGEGDVSIGISLGGVSANWNDTSGDYGYSRWYGRDYDQRRFASNWTFVDTGRLADRDYRHDAYNQDRAFTAVSQTRNITNYTVSNHYMVNRSIDVHAVERASGHSIVAVTSAAVFKHPNLVVTVEAGQKNRTREFEHAPHGTGLANSAPPPPQSVISKLSDKVAVHHAGGTGAKVGGAPSHLFTKTTIAAPAATAQFHGKPKAGPMGVTPATTPLAPTGLHEHATPTVGEPATATKPPTVMMGPGAAHGAAPAGAGSMAEPGKMHEKHTGPVGPGGAPTTTVVPPATMVGPGTAHNLAPTGAGSASEPVKMHEKHTPGANPMGETGGSMGMTEKPVVHPLNAGPVVPPHAVLAPVTPPAVHMAPVVHTPPPVVYVAPPVVHTPPPVVHTPPPVVHTPPPVVYVAPPVVHTPPPVVHEANPPPKGDKKKEDKKNETAPN